jgi:hypothetical protein
LARRQRAGFKSLKGRQMGIESHLKGLSLQLRATGPATVLVAWIAGVTLLGLFGRGDIATFALSALCGAGGILVLALLFGPPDDLAKHAEQENVEQNEGQENE